MRQVLLAGGVLCLLLLCWSCSDDNKDVPAAPVRDRVVRVPGEMPTLQAGIDSAYAGDTVLVADGIYTGDGNRDLTLGDKQFVLISEHGPEVTIIDCAADSSNAHRAIAATYQPDGTVIKGFTIRNGYASQGAAIDCHVSDLRVENCVFVNNTAVVSGGAVRCKASAPMFTNCTFVGNRSQFGGAVHLMAHSRATFERCLFVDNAGAAIGMNGGDDTPTLSCSGLFGNVGGDWSTYIAGQDTLRNNFSADPQFCGPSDYHVRPGSPAAPANNGCNMQVGALGVGCE